MSVARGAALAATGDALHDFLVQFVFGHTANAACLELTVCFLDTSQTAKTFKPTFLPLGDEIGVSPFLSQAIVVELPGNLVLLEE